MNTKQSIVFKKELTGVIEQDLKIQKKHLNKYGKIKTQKKDNVTKFTICKGI